MNEPTISINGATLTEAQAMTIRVAVTDFVSRMATAGALGSDDGGEDIRRGYKERSGEVIRIMLTPPPSTHVAGLTLTHEDVWALVYGIPKNDLANAIQKMAAWLRDNPPALATTEGQDNG